jgi:ABC-type sulfate transport system permease subunit
LLPNLQQKPNQAIILTAAVANGEYHGIFAVETHLKGKEIKNTWLLINLFKQSYSKLIDFS